MHRRSCWRQLRLQPFNGRDDLPPYLAALHVAGFEQVIGADGGLEQGVFPIVPDEQQGRAVDVEGGCHFVGFSRTHDSTPITVASPVRGIVVGSPTISSVSPLTTNLRACSEPTQGSNHAISTVTTKRSGGSTR